MAALTRLNTILGFQPPSSIKSVGSATAIPTGLHLRSFSIHASSLISRFSHTANLPDRKTHRTTVASNSDPLPSENSIQAKAAGSNNSNETARTPQPQGPPLLTIVAGFLVLFLVCWIIGSLVIWAVSPIAKLLTSK